MRLAVLVLAVLLSAPAWSVTFDFESVPGLTPIAYEVGATVPDSARISSLTLPGGGQIQLKTSGGKRYAALVTHAGQTSIVAVDKKGRISSNRFLDIVLKKAPKGTSIAAVMVINAGPLFGDDPSTPGTTETDFVLGYDQDGFGQFRVVLAGGKQLRTFQFGRTQPEPLILTGASRAVVRLLVGGSFTFGDLVILEPGAPASPAVPEPALPALLGAAAAALAFRARTRRAA